MFFTCRAVAKIAALWTLASVAEGAYVKSESYTDGDFFSKFTFYTQPDLSLGHVSYVDYETAVQQGLVASLGGGGVQFGADRASQLPKKEPRNSVRIQSNAVYNSGLFVISLSHMPTGCGMWPAFWLYGEDDEHIWPALGEFDIFEAVHGSTEVFTSLHTSAGCDQSPMQPGADFASQWEMGKAKVADNCDVDAPGQWLNQGCSQTGPPGSAGPGFNAQGGGTYVAEWNPQSGLRTWLFPPGAEPVDLLQGAPDPNSWGTPFSSFTLGPTCPASHFQDMRLVFDVNLCGKLGDNKWQALCPDIAATMTCHELISAHPEQLQEAYFSIASLDVYQWQGDAEDAGGDEYAQEDDGGLSAVVAKFSQSRAPASPASPGVTLARAALVLVSSLLAFGAAAALSWRLRGRLAAREASRQSSFERIAHASASEAECSGE